MQNLTPEIQQEINEYEDFMLNLDSASTDEKLERLSDHLVVIGLLEKENNQRGLSDAKTNAFKILFSIGNKTATTDEDRINNRLEKVYELSQKVAEGELTLPQALLAMSYMANLNFPEG